MKSPNQQPADEAIDRAARNLKDGREVEESAQVLVQHLRARLVSYFRRNNFSDADAEDLTQETFRRVFTGIKGLNDADRFRAWFFQVARNVRFSAYVAAGQRDVALDADAADPVAAHEPDPLLTTLQREALARTWEAVHKLPEQQKQCLVLRVVHEMSYEEIARVMHLSVETVRTHLKVARLNLRRALKGAAMEGVADGQL